MILEVLNIAGVAAFSISGVLAGVKKLVKDKKETKRLHKLENKKIEILEIENRLNIVTGKQIGRAHV